MTNKKSHEENVRYMYQFYKDTGQHDKAREYKQQQKNIARMFGRKDPFSSGGAAIGIGVGVGTATAVALNDYAVGFGIGIAIVIVMKLAVK